MILPPSTAATVIMVMISMPGCPAPSFPLMAAGLTSGTTGSKSTAVYALWYNGQFGEDNLYLLRPFSTTSQTPAVTVRYRYTLNSIRSPEKDQPLTPA